MDSLFHISSPSIFLPLPAPRPYPPYIPLHLASRFIVYFMIITPTPDYPPFFWDLFSLSQGFLFWLSTAFSSHFFFTTRSTKAYYWYPHHNPSNLDYFHFQSHIPFLYLILTDTFLSLPSPQRYTRRSSVCFVVGSVDLVRSGTFGRIVVCIARVVRLGTIGVDFSW